MPSSPAEQLLENVPDPCCRGTVLVLSLVTMLGVLKVPGGQDRWLGHPLAGWVTHLSLPQSTGGSEMFRLSAETASKTHQEELSGAAAEMNSSRSEGHHEGLADLVIAIAQGWLHPLRICPLLFFVLLWQ